MGDLRDTPHFSFKTEMDRAIGSAVKSMGPRTVLNAIPLEITGDKYADKILYSFLFITLHVFLFLKASFTFSNIVTLIICSVIYTENLTLIKLHFCVPSIIS